MDGFKDSTKMKYMGGGMVDGYAKGGSAKAGAKIAKVMGEFKKGELHSGSKEGPKVKSPKQAMAIAMSEAGKAPMKKGGGGDVKMPSPAESAASGNRMSAQEGAEMREMRMMREMKKRVPATRREPMLPPVGESAKSGNRMSAQEGAEARKMKMAVGGKFSAPNKMSVDYGPVKRPAPPPTLERKPKIELSASGKARLEAQAAAMKRAPGRAVPVTPGIPSKISPPNLRDISPRNPFVDTMPKMTLPSGPPPAGMAPVNPGKAAMMKKGGLAVMPKGKC